MGVRFFSLRAQAMALAVILAPALVIASQAPVRGVSAGWHAAGPARPGYGSIDCNGWNSVYHRLKPGYGYLCADPVRVHNGKYSRFTEDGSYVGHDEPQVRFISGAPGSGNTMTYFMKLPVDPARPPTASGSITDSAELGVPWFGMELCDPLSYPQNPCIPDSDRNLGGAQPTAAGSALMELQFYPPGFPPFIGGMSCGRAWWCAALTIDSLECTFNMVRCNPNCTEILNFAFLQTNGVPAGPPAPQAGSLSSLLPNRHTLRMYPGNVVKVSITDPPGGLTTRVTDLTTGASGYMVASAANGFADTRISNCSGRKWTFHAEYDTARRQNLIPWISGDGGVVMTQEIGHIDSCASVIHKTAGFVPQDYQTCVGGIEGKGQVGPGPCTRVVSGICRNPEAEGLHGPVACPTRRASFKTLCEFTGQFCAPRGMFPFTLNHMKLTQIVPVTYCEPTDLDFDGENYLSRAWPDGTAAHPAPLAMAGPFSHRAAYPVVQFETDVGGFERLCQIPSGTRCQAPPLGARFYPYWTVNHTQRLAGLPLSFRPCVWNFGRAIPGFTIHSFGGDREYGKPDAGRFTGTLISAPRRNLAVTGACSPFPRAPAQPGR